MNAKSQIGTAFALRRVVSRVSVFLQGFSAMKTVEFNESEQLALLAELARPLVHESNNFLNNLFLHMALLQEQLPQQFREDWESVRQEGKRLEFLLREWQEFWRGSVGKNGKIELNQMIAEIVERLCPKNHLNKVAISLFPEPLWLNGRTGELQRFVRLLLHVIIDFKESDLEKSEVFLTIQTGKKGDRVLLHILNIGSMASKNGWSEFEVDTGDRPGVGRASLSTAACRSMARHIHGKIRVEKDPAGRCDLVVEFAD
jgi:hypothetical protein